MNENKIAVSVTEAARLLGVSRPIMYRIMKQDGFPYYKVGSRTLIDLQGLRDWSRRQAGVAYEEK